MMKLVTNGIHIFHSHSRGGGGGDSGSIKPDSTSTDHYFMKNESNNIIRAYIIMILVNKIFYFY